MMSKRIAFVTFILLLFTFFTYGQNDNSKKEPEVTIITINNARQTSYKKAEDSGNDTIVLEGSVSLSVQKGNSTNEIKADKITYDRKTEMLYAEGNVSITMKGGSSGNDTATASSLLLNTSSLEGVFDGGRIVQTQSDALNLPSGSTLIVFSDIFAKGNENVITFKNSSLTFCDEEEPHWHIDATRTWLLPGGEFAFFNALLYVGVVPVLYFPAFYYPKDELIFNPVFGYTKREGYFVQTTTYLWGRKPLNSSSTKSSSSSSSSSTEKESTSAESLKAVYNFIKPTSLKEQVREGLVLHNLDEDYKGDTSHYVKLMADWYSNLGYMFGVEGKLQPAKNYISRLDFNALIGISDTIFKHSDGEYYPFSATGVTYKDDSVFLGVKMPFRYSAGIDFQLSKPFRFSLSLPIYSDPYFNYDFKTNRMETMDWISYFLESSKDDDKEPTITEVSNFTWNASSSYSPKLPSLMQPYVSSLSFDIKNSVNISSKTTEAFPDKTAEYDSSWKNYTPSRKFYYPSLVTPVSANVTMSGTLFSWPPKSSTSSASPTFVITMNKPDELKTEKQLEEERRQAEEKAAAEAAQAEDQNQNSDKDDKAQTKPEEREDEEEEEEELFDYLNPELEYTAKKESVSDGITYNLSYSMGLNPTNQLAYASSNLKKSEDFNWSEIRSAMYNIKMPMSLTSKFNYGGSFFSIENKFSFSPVFQEHTYISLDTENGGYTESDANKLRVADYKAENRDVSNSNSVVLKPFVYVPFMSDTNVSWNSNIKLYRRKFTSDNADEPEWEESFADWSDEESVTVNSVSADVRANELDKKLTQSIKFEAVMPPLLKKYTTTLTLGFPYVTASVSTGFQESKADTEYNRNTKDLKNKDMDKEWKKSPLNQSLSVSMFNSKVKVSENFSYNLEDDNPDSLKLSASAFGMNLSYVASYVKGYDLTETQGTTKEWKSREDKEFLPYSLSFSYSMPSKTYYQWFNRISVAPSLSTSAVADLLRPTNSYLLFSPGLKFKIHEIIDISFSATSRNSVLYWYFKNEEGDLYSDWGGFPGNICKDLIDSFRFDDEDLRRNSGFKLKSFNMSISHDLHDWKANMTMKIEPRVVNEGGKHYDFKPYITIGVVWNPMESMKTSIIDEYGEWKLE